MKAEDIKNKKSFINLTDGKHEITIDFNALEELESMYGGIDVARASFTTGSRLNTVKRFLCASINACIEDVNEHFSPFQVGKLLKIQESESYMDILTQLINKSMPAEEETEIEEYEEGKN